MGAWNKLFYGMRLIFVGNGSDKSSSADVKLKKIKRHIACRPLWVNKTKREVLLMES